LRELGGPGGELMLALIEGLARDDLFSALAAALEGQPDLAPDLAWTAIEVLEGTGRIESNPTLSSLRDELEEALAEVVPLAELAREIEEDPDSIPLAVAALARIEPEVRLEIIGGLGAEAATPALINFLESLARSDDSRTREAASEALRHATGRGACELATTSHAPALIASVVGPLDADGRGTILLVSEGASGHVFARFECDVREGIVAASFASGLARDQATDRAEEVAGTLGPEAARDCPISAKLFLAGSAWLSEASLAEGAKAGLRATLGEMFEPRPIFADPGAIMNGPTTAADPFDDARAILSRRPEWHDRSPLARDLAVEIRLRGESALPDPGRDPGPFRVLFEGRILGRIELYRRMLLWSAMVWQEAGEPPLSQAAMRIVAALGDPQNAVPGTPFLEELMIRSLAGTGN
jgi:hypothetical protein